MSADSLSVPNSIEFAQELQLEMLDLPFDKKMERVESALGILEVSDEIGQTFLIESRMAFLRAPRQSGGRPHLLKFTDPITVEGTLDTFSYFSIGRLDIMPINSLCVALNRLRFYPDQETVDPEAVLHIPALAVGIHMKTAA